MEHPLKDFSRDKLVKPKGASHSFQGQPFAEPAWSVTKSFWKSEKPFFKKVFAVFFAGLSTKKQKRKGSKS